MIPKKAHLIGAGGAGMSAIAKYLYQQGYTVTGSDATVSQTITDLSEKYSFQYMGDHKSDNVRSDLEFVVYTPAVGPQNPEYQKAQSLGIPLYSYPEYLGVISKDKKTIAVSGTNGKTTTTTMVGELLVDQGFDPTIIVGGVMQEFSSNYKEGGSDLFVVEACEYKHSFLSLTPSVLVITNITPDHMEYFETFENYQNTFVSLVERMSENGVVICDPSDEALLPIVQKAGERGLSVYDYTQKSFEKQLSVPGEHNRKNAFAALSVLDTLGGEMTRGQSYLQEFFRGSKRRFELLGQTKDGFSVYDDYAHNPEAIETLVGGLRTRYPESSIVMFFQPHLYSRTKDLFEGFVQSLLLPDQVFLLPIYAAREESDDDISSVILAEAMKIQNPSADPIVCTDFDDAQAQFESYDFPKSTIVLVVGAGDVYKLGQQLVQ